MSPPQRRESPLPRPPESDTAATLAWFVARQEALHRDGEADPAAQAALEAEVEAYGAKTLAALEQAQRQAEAEFASVRSPSQASAWQRMQPATRARIARWVPIALVAVIVGLAYLARRWP